MTGATTSIICCIVRACAARVEGGGCGGERDDFERATRTVHGREGGRCRLGERGGVHPIPPPQTLTPNNDSPPHSLYPQAPKPDALTHPHSVHAHVFSLSARPPSTYCIWPGGEATSRFCALQLVRLPLAYAV